MIKKKELIENIHYYTEEGRVVFTALFLSERRYCCGNGCKNCPYEPKHTAGNKILMQNVAKSKDT